MANVNFWLSLGVFIAACAIFLEIALGHRKLKRLIDITPAFFGDPPRVSIILTALNEAATIEPALRSVLSLNYPNLEIIAINDRSTDDTPAILDRLREGHAALKVVHISDLPTGWLGKNHALHQGSKLATGDYLIFTDADVVFDPTVIARAVTYCQQNELHHLAIFPEVPTKENLFAALLLRFQFSLFLQYKPWKVRAPNKYFTGIGAFNMVRSREYREAGGHEALRMDVIDDLVLGKIMKAHGFTQEAMVGAGLISVAWYESSREMFKGLRKNIFAAFDYKLSKLAALSVFFAVFTLWPWIGVVVTGGATRWINIATVALELAFYWDILRGHRWSRWCLLYLPLSSVLSIFMWWQGSLLVWMRGEIEWRGTRYSLAELRRRRR